MKRKHLYIVTALIGILLIFTTLCGCADENQSGLTIEEPNITVDYLTGDYADQLLRDGAEHVFGSIKLSETDDGEVAMVITAKELVEDSSQPEGYYIADRNMQLTCPLASEARTTFLSGDTSIASILTTEQFVADFQADVDENGGEDSDAYLQSRYYDIYIMNGQAELVLAVYLP